MTSLPQVLELLRETGRFEESRQILLKHKSDDDKWVVDAMFNYIEKEDAEPFLLVEKWEYSKRISSC